MGRQYFDDAPDPLAADQAAVASGLAQAYSAVQSDQQEAAAFINAHGAAVLGGHPDTRQAGRQGDPDVYGPDAADQ